MLMLLFSYFQCSVTCGMGSRYRKVACMEGDSVVKENHCISEKPTSKVECFMGNCPKWVEGPWGPVSLFSSVRH